MTFKDKHDVWSKEEDDVDGVWSGWIVAILFAIPWLVGVGAIFCWLTDTKF